MTEQAAEEGPVKNMSNPHKSKGLPFIYTFVLLLWNGRSPSECQANIKSLWSIHMKLFSIVFLLRNMKL